MSYKKVHFELDEKAIGNAINLIVEGLCKKVEVSNEILVYKVPSQNPKKYIIRIDIKEEEK